METSNEKENSENDELRRRDKIIKFLESHLFHKIVIIFVVIDCLCVSLEFMLESIEQYFITDRENDYLKSNETFNLNNSNKTDQYHSSKNVQAHLIFYVLISIFKYGSITILGMFCIEIIAKILFTPKVYLKIWEILDAFVILTSFALNLYLVKTKFGMSVLFITILRLWRVFEIINGNLIQIF